MPTARTLIVTNPQAGYALLLDNNNLVGVHDFKLPFPLHERVWQSPDGRYSYLSSPEGWVTKIDLNTSEISQQLRIGQMTSGIALSDDGRTLMAGNMIPATLVAIDTEKFSIIRSLEVKNKAGKPSGVAAIHTAAARRSFVAVMQDIPELWELSYDEHAEPVYEGLVHDYKMGEGLASRGPFAPRRTELEQPLAHFFVDAGSALVIGADQNGLVQIINLNIRRKIHDLRFPSAAQPDSGALWKWKNRLVFALPQNDEKNLSIIDAQSWQVTEQIPVAEKNMRLHEHPQSRYIWLESPQPEAASGGRNQTQILDKQTLSVIALSPGLLADSSAPLAWTEDGRFVFLYGGNRKEILIYDTQTLELQQRIPLSPSSNKTSILLSPAAIF